jgi:ATP-binding cassette subfamily B protein
MTDPSLDELARFSKLFMALDEPARKRLMALSSKRAFAAGAVICKEGDESADFFVVTRGKVTVSGDDLGEEKSLGSIGPGQFFGEMAALTGQKRQATVTAAEATELVCFPKQAIETVLKESPQARQLLQKVGLLRTEDTVKKMME